MFIKCYLMVQPHRVKTRLNSLWKRSMPCTRNKFFKITSRFSRGSRRSTWKTNTKFCFMKRWITLKTKISSRIWTKRVPLSLAQNSNSSSTSSRHRSTFHAKRPITCASRQSRPSKPSNHRRWKTSLIAHSNPRFQWTRTARRWPLLPLCLNRLKRQEWARKLPELEITTHKFPPN